MVSRCSGPAPTPIPHSSPYFSSCLFSTMDLDPSFLSFLKLYRCFFFVFVPFCNVCCLVFKLYVYVSMWVHFHSMLALCFLYVCLILQYACFISLSVYVYVLRSVKRRATDYNSSGKYKHVGNLHFEPTTILNKNTYMC